VQIFKSLPAHQWTHEELMSLRDYCIVPQLSIVRAGNAEPTIIANTTLVPLFVAFASGSR
jgi:hypothetical protein